MQAGVSWGRAAGESRVNALVQGRVSKVNAGQGQLGAMQPMPARVNRVNVAGARYRPGSVGSMQPVHGAGQCGSIHFESALD